MAKTGPETWEISGQPYRIASTYFLGLPNGIQYTIDYEVPRTVNPHGLSDAKAFEIAAPIMHYAVDHQLYQRTEIKLDGVRAKVSLIGVSLFRRSGLTTSGYRISRPIASLRASSPHRSRATR